jgi:hypothetical protein
MVRVISAHHFSAQDVAPCPAAPICSRVAESWLLLATRLHQVQGWKKPGFLKIKPSPGFFFVFFCFFLVSLVFWVFWGFWFFYIFAQKREFLGFVQFQEYF